MARIEKPKSMLIAEKEVALKMIMCKLNIDNYDDLKLVCQAILGLVDEVEELKKDC